MPHKVMEIKSPVFFSDTIENEIVILRDQEALHCSKVLRMQTGQILFVTDGKGIWVKAQIINILKDTVHTAVLQTQLRKSAPIHTQIYIAPPKQTERLDYILEKVTELGIDDIHFVQTHRTERNRFDIEKLRKKAIAPLKQSKRAMLPGVWFHESVPKAWQAGDQRPITHMIAYIDIQRLPFINTHLQTQKGFTSAALWIGPEGDFTIDEIQFLQQRGVAGVTLGQQILRTDTAAIVGAAYLMAWSQLQSGE